MAINVVYTDVTTFNSGMFSCSHTSTDVYEPSKIRDLLDRMVSGASIETKGSPYLGGLATAKWSEVIHKLLYHGVQEYHHDHAQDDELDGVSNEVKEFVGVVNRYADIGISETALADECVVLICCNKKGMRTITLLRREDLLERMHVAGFQNVLDLTGLFTLVVPAE